MAGNDPLVVSYKDAEGNAGEITTSGVYQQLQQAGYPVTGVSADGMEFHFSDPRGEYSMAIPDIMKNLGHEVNYVEPTAPDTSKINLGYRAAISRLPDDDAKKAYIESKLKREGVENANVIGNGRNWHFYDPNTNQWHALTNTKDWDMADLAEGGIEAVHGLSAAAGGIAGGYSAGTLGAMGGAAGGGALSEAAMRGALNYADPEYSDVTTLGGQAKDIALGAGLDAGMVGGTMLLGSAAQPLLKNLSKETLQRIATTGIGSTIMKGVGNMTKAAGHLTGAAGKATDNSLVREGIKAVTPGLSQAQMASTALQAPEWITGATAKAAQKAAGSRAAESVLGKETAQGLKEGAEEILTKQAPASWYENLNRHFRGSAADAPKVRSSDILGNAAEKGAGKVAGKINAHQMSKGVDAGDLLNAEEIAKTAGQYGRNTGKVFESMGTVGRNIDKASDVAVKGMGAGLKAGGAAMKGAGNAAYVAGSVAQPFENAALASYGARALGQDPLRKLLLEKERKALQDKMKRSKIEESFAHN